MSKTGMLADLLAGPGNRFWDLGRILSALSILGVLGAAGWNVWSGQPIDLMSLGGGLAAVLTAAAALIALKDRADRLPEA